MSKDELPSIEDFNGDDNLPSIKDFIAEEKAEELPSVEDYVEKKEEILTEATQTIEDAEGNSFAEVKDIVPPWPELVKMVNDVRADIPDIPEIKYYDKELEDLAEQISRVRDEIPEVPEVRYYEKEVEAICEQIDLVREHIKDLPEVKYYDEQVDAIEDRIDTLQTEVTNLPEVKYYDREIEAICSAIDQVRSEIPTFPKWVNEVNEVPDFSWIGKTFSVIDDDFTKVNDSIDTLKENIQLDIRKLVEDNEVRHFENKIEIGNEVKDLNTKLGEEKDKIWKELRDSSMKIWEYHREFKDDDRKLKKQILGEYNTLKQNIKKELKEVSEESVKTDELLLKYFTDLREEVSGIVIPEVKYYDDDLRSIRGDIASLKKLVQTIKTEQKNLSEGLLNEPPNEKESVGGQPDPLTPMDQNFATLDDLSKHYRLFINRIQEQISTIGGGGAGFIKDLDDVTFDQTTGTNKLLIYDGAKWVGIASTAIKGSTTLDEVLSEGNTSTTGMSVGVVTATSFEGSGTNLTGIVTSLVAGENISISSSTGQVTITGLANTANVVAETLVVSGVSTLGEISGTTASFSGNVSVGGTLTYEDVTNVDSIGLVTARTGIDVLAGGINVTGVSTFNSDVSFDGNIDGNVTIVSTDAGSAAAPELTLYRNSASPAPGDYLGQLMFKGENSNGGQENYAKITGKITDETLGTEDGLIETAIKGDGSFTIVSRQRSDELQLINGVGLSVDGTSTFEDNVTINANISNTGTAVFGSSTGVGTVHIGTGNTALIVRGDARITGVLTVGEASVTIDGDNNVVTVGIVTISNSEVVIGENVTINAGATGINSAPNVLYVAKDGNDDNNGTSIDNAKLTISAAVGIATTGTVIKVLAGNYAENNPIEVPAFVSVVGDDLKTVTVTPNTANDDLFHVRKGCYLANMTFTNHVAPAAAIGFPTSEVATNVGGGKWESPYIQNCTSNTTTGTGLRIDGDQAESLKSIVVDSYTQYNQGGVGVAITNSGFAQLVSVFTICCNEAITCHKGSTCDLTNSNSSFGTFGLVSDGVSEQQFTGVVTATAAAAQDTVTIGITTTTRPYNGQVVYFGELFESVQTISVGSGGTGYTSTPTVTVDAPTGPSGETATAFATLEGESVTSITIISSGSQYQSTPNITISAPDVGINTATATANMSPIYYTINSSTPIVSGISTLTLDENLINSVGVGTTVYFFQQSKIVASSHTFEYVGSGNDITSATPLRGGVPVQANEVVTSNGGNVVYTSTDQSGNFRIGDDFEINQNTGTISGRAFSRSLFSEMTPFILALS